ncbi:hypothetical protein P3T40_008978 [Paraburkholderia sp. EB58]|jgi:hypothetical protein
MGRLEVSPAGLSAVMVFHQSGFTTFLFGSPYTFRKPDKTGCDTVADAPVRRLSSLKMRFVMNLMIWLPGLFVLGLGCMALCVAFIDACDKI